MSDLLLFLVMSLASYRLHRVIAADSWPPAKWFRHSLAERTMELAETTHERRAAVPATVEEMLLCSWCGGSWIAFAVVSVTTLFTSVPVPVFQALAVACAVGLIGANLDD